MGLLNKKVPYLHDNFLLSACQFTANSQGNGKFMEFVCLHGYLLEITKILPAEALFHLFVKVFLPTHCFVHWPKFSTVWYMYTKFITYGFIVFCVGRSKCATVL